MRKSIISLFEQSLAPSEYEVIVVDSSPDEANQELVEGLREEAPIPLRYYRKRPEGPGPSRNLGAQRARADFVAFIDSDCQAHPGWLESSLGAFEPGVGIVQGKTLPDPEGSLGVFTWYPLNERENFVYECTNIVYRREALEQAGGFPPDPEPTAESPLGGEDVQLAWNVKRAGWTSRFAAESIVYHEVVPISVWRWLFARRLLIWPRLTKAYPELRRYFVARYFWDEAQAYLVLALCGVVLAALTPWTLALAMPYVLFRALPSSKSFPGLLRPLRVVPYLIRDMVWFLTLVAGSVRHRCLLL